MIECPLRRLRLGSLFVGSLVIGSWVGSAEAAEPLATLEGDAFVRATATADFGPTKTGANLTPGYGVRSGMGATAAVKAGDGVVVRLGQGSTVTLRPSTQLPAEHPGASPLHAFQIMLSDGEVDLDVHDPALGVLVQLPNGRSFGLWKGAANVSIHGDDVAIGLYEGTGIAGSASKWKALTSGSATVLTLKGDALPAKVSLAKPQWDDGASSNSFAVVRGDEKTVLSAGWKPVAGAKSYRVEIGHDGSMLGGETILSSDAPALKTEPLGPGAYIARVRAVTAEGIAGPPSATKALRVTRVTIPASAFAAPDGAIVLPANQGIQLDDPRDLEVATAFDGAQLTQWSPAPKAIDLGSARRRDVRVRHVGSKEESRFVLVKRELRASVAFSPRPARWPNDPIDIVVKVADTSGYLDPSKEKIDVDVRLDIDRQNIEWSHAGDTWRGRLAPKKDGGPWVVRVNVADSAGVPIGAGLLDVDGPGSAPQNVARAGYGNETVSYAQ